MSPANQAARGIESRFANFTATFTKGAVMGGRPTGAKVRQVIAIFHSGAQLERALKDLEHAGVHAQQRSLLAGQKLVEKDLRPSLDKASASALAALVGDLTDIGIIDHSGPILVSAGPLAKLLKSSADKPVSVRSVLNKWLIHRHAQALVEQLEAGACLLWVKVCNEKEERQTCGVLLQLSEHPVQVHDIPNGSEPPRP